MQEGDLGSALVVEPSGTRIARRQGRVAYAVTLLQGVLAGREARAQLQGYGVPASVISEGARRRRRRTIEEITPPRNDTSRGIAYLAALLLYLAILTYGLFIATGIVTEKATRVVEVILSAVRPDRAARGQGRRARAAEPRQFWLVAVVALVTAEVAGVSLPAGAPLAIVLAVVFSLLGYLLYACAFAVAGSIVSRRRTAELERPAHADPRRRLHPHPGLALEPARHPLHRALDRPLTAPLAMPSRVALTDVPTWEIVLSAGLTLATALARAAARSRHLLGHRAADGAAGRAARRAPAALRPERALPSRKRLDRPIDPTLPRLRRSSLPRRVRRSPCGR